MSERKVIKWEPSIRANLYYKGATAQGRENDVRHGFSYSYFQISCFCTDGKISVRIDLPLFSTVLASNSCCFSPVGLSLLIRHFQQVLWVLKLLFHCPSIEQLLFLSCRPVVAITTFSTGHVGVKVTSVSSSIPTRPVENFITTKGLQERNNNC